MEGGITIILEGGIRLQSTGGWFQPTATIIGLLEGGIRILERGISPLTSGGWYQATEGWHQASGGSY